MFLRCDEGLDLDILRIASFRESDPESLLGYFHAPATIWILALQITFL